MGTMEPKSYKTFSRLQWTRCPNEQNSALILMPSVAPKHFILKNKKGIVLLYIEIQPSVVEELKHCI